MTSSFTPEQRAALIEKFFEERERLFEGLPHAEELKQATTTYLGRSKFSEDEDNKFYVEKIFPHFPGEPFAASRYHSAVLALWANLWGVDPTTLGLTPAVQVEPPPADPNQLTVAKVEEWYRTTQPRPTRDELRQEFMKAVDATKVLDEHLLKDELARIISLRPPDPSPLPSAAAHTPPSVPPPAPASAPVPRPITSVRSAVLGPTDAHTFLISLKGVFKILNEVDGKEDQELGLKLRDIIRDFLAQPSQSQVAEDKAKKGLKDELGKFFNSETEPLLAKLPLLEDPDSRGPKYRLYDLILEQRNAGVTPAIPASGPTTPPPASAPAPAPSSAPARTPSPLGRTTTDDVDELYQDPTVREILTSLLVGTTEVRTKVMQTLLQTLKDQPYSKEFPAKLTKALVAKFEAWEGWAQDAKEEHVAQQELEAEAQRIRDEEEAEQAEIMIGAVPPTTARPSNGRAERATTGKRDFFLKRLVRSIPKRLKWWLSGFAIAAILVLAAFTLAVRQPNNFKETNNNVVTRDETVDEMYSWTFIGFATAGLSIVFGFGFVGTYCSFFERRKESGA